MPYLDVLREIKARKPPQWRQHFAEKDIHAKSMKDLRRWNDEIMTPVQFRLKLKTPGSTFGRGRGVFTARTFRMNYYRREIVDVALPRHGVAGGGAAVTGDAHYPGGRIPTMTNDDHDDHDDHDDRGGLLHNF